MQKMANELYARLLPVFPAPLDALDDRLLRHACLLLIRSQRALDPDVAVRLSGEGRRTLEGLRRRLASAKSRPQQTTSFADHLAELAAKGGLAMNLRAAQSFRYLLAAGAYGPQEHGRASPQEGRWRDERLGASSRPNKRPAVSL
jgi:hypothetical protein